MSGISSIIGDGGFAAFERELAEALLRLELESTFQFNVGYTAQSDREMSEVSITLYDVGDSAVQTGKI